MTEKSKNDEKRKRPYGKIAAYGCGFFLLMSLACGGTLYFLARELFSGGFAMGPGAADFCMSTDGVHGDFKVLGRVLDTQGQPIHQANVELGSKSPIACVKEVTSYDTVTNENGEFSFEPVIFAYTKGFFISANADGCQTSMIYDDLAQNEAVTIVLDCTTPSTP